MSGRNEPKEILQAPERPCDWPSLYTLTLARDGADHYMGRSMDSYLQTNRALWDERVPLHRDSAFYDLLGFKGGRCSLKSIELAELGAVTGKSLLHLQCHFGMDTLSWARRGAHVTGTDFSDQAIALAQSLSAELAIPARFVCANLYDLPQMLTAQFDIVFTSAGVLGWLPDIQRWGEVIAHFLRPGGTFYIREKHPFANTFGDTAAAAPTPQLASPYFDPEPTRWEESGSYAEPQAETAHNVHYEWQHTLGDIVNALTTQGLRLEYLHEFPLAGWKCLPGMEQGDDGWWRLPGQETLLPLTFSLKATKQ